MGQSSSLHEVVTAEDHLVQLKTFSTLCGAGIHPRFKHEVGRRLAVALMKNVSGPTIAGCKLDSAKASITVTLDPDRMGGEDILVQPFDINVSAWSGDDSSTLMVCTGQLGSALANATSCACSGWAYLRTPNPKDPTNHGHDQSLWYCEAGPGTLSALHEIVTAERSSGPTEISIVAPGWKPSQQQIELSIGRHASAVTAAAGSKAGVASGRGGSTVGSGLGWVPDRNPFEKIWQPARVAKGTEPHSLSVDLRSVNGSATGSKFSLLCRGASRPAMLAKHFLH